MSKKYFKYLSFLLFFTALILIAIPRLSKKIIILDGPFTTIDDFKTSDSENQYYTNDKMLFKNWYLKWINTNPSDLSVSPKSLYSGQGLVQSYSENTSVRSYNILENNLSTVAGGSRKIVFNNYLSSPNVLGYDGESSIYVKNSRTDINHHIGTLTISNSGSSRSLSQIIYDQNGEGLNLDLSASKNLIINYSNEYNIIDEVPQTPQTIDLTIKTKSGMSASKSFYLSTEKQINTDEILSIPLSWFKSSLGDVSNVSSLTISLDAGLSGSITLDNLMLDGFGYTIKGKAILKNSTNPVVGADIVVPTYGGRLSGQIVRGKTDNDGNFSVNRIFIGTYGVGISKTGYKLSSKNFDNSFSISNSSKADIVFELECADGYQLNNGECIIPIELTASEGTIEDKVVLKWNKSSTCSVLRKGLDENIFSSIATGITNTYYKDSTGESGVKYKYIVICDDIISNEVEGFRGLSNNICPKDTDCGVEELKPSACTNANGFLNQINITTISNKDSANLDVKLDYIDQNGEVKGSLQTTLGAYQKSDFIINDLGLKANTYGSICVSTNATKNGSWGGGNTLYKSDLRKGNSSFGDSFDFVLYYPFTNPKFGTYSQFLNTTHYGVSPNSTVANWIQISDGNPNDGSGLSGVLSYYNSSGEIINTESITLQDGGRVDISGHEKISGSNNVDSSGIVKFTPNLGTDSESPSYYFSVGRYFYDCIGAGCSNFHTAFVMPNRPATNVNVSNAGNSKNSESVILEIANPSNTHSSNIRIKGFNSKGETKQNLLSLNVNNSNLFFINKEFSDLMKNNNFGSTSLKSETGNISATSISYKLDQKGKLKYAYTNPMASSNSAILQTEFNSFIGNKNTLEIFNSIDKANKIQILIRNSNNRVVSNFDIELNPYETKRIPLEVPNDTYGSIIATGLNSGFSINNLVTRESSFDDYALSFIAQ